MALEQRPGLDSIFVTTRSSATRPPLQDIFKSTVSTPKAANIDRFLKPAFKALDMASLPFGQRAKTAAMSGLPAAVAGIKPEQAAKTADLVGPAVASTVGAVVGGRPGMVAGATASRAINEAGKKAMGLPQTQPRKLFGIGPVAPGPVNDIALEGAGTYLGDKALSFAGKVAQKAAPQMTDKAVRMAQKILKPGGALKPKAEKIAEDSLRYDVLRGDLSKTTDMIEAKLGDLDNQLTNLLDHYKNKTMSGDDVVRAFDDLEAGYLQNASPERASQIASLRDEFIKSQQLQKPVMGMVEKEPYLGVQQSEPGVVGKVGREIPVGEAQNLKRGQYDLLKEMRSEGGYNVATKSPEIRGRQAAARAYKEGVAKNVPGAGDINAKMSDLIGVGDAANARLPVAERNNFFDLGDLALASGGKVGLATVRKAFGAGQAKIARGLYKGAGPVARLGNKLASPTVRALSQIPSRLLTSQFTEN